MKTTSDFAPILGLPVRHDEGHLIEEVASAWSVTLPADFVAIAGAYGDAVISDYIYVCGARTLRKYADGMGRKLEASQTVPHTVLPTPGGALVWGNTIEGDQLFLVPHEGGAWTVSAFRRGWADWHDTDLGFSDWLYLALSGGTATDWLPEWEPLPHAIDLGE